VLKVLIVEDDLLMADMVEMLLVDSGYDVCGIARNVAEAVALVTHAEPFAAISAHRSHVSNLVASRRSESGGCLSPSRPGLSCCPTRQRSHARSSSSPS